MASAAVKGKPTSSSSNLAGGSKGKISGPTLKRKIESSGRQQSVPLKSAKIEEKGKGIAIAPPTPTPKAKREKKVFSLPGQKCDPPEEREPLRIFYESLSKQIPTSEMAEFWMMEHGLLSPERARKAYEKKQRKQKQLRMGIPIKSPPIKSPPPPSRPESSNRQKPASKNGDTKAKRKIVEDSDDEVIGSPKRRRA